MEEIEEDEQMGGNETQKNFPTKNEDSVEEKLRELVENEEAEFDDWTSLISITENTSPIRIETIRKVYDAFLLVYPLCYGYWIKYAHLMSYHCTLNEAENVYERAVGVIPYSVDIWVSYCSFGVLAYEDSADIRRLFERGLSFVNKDYSSYLLWDKYIEFEYSLKQWSQLAYVYINTLSFPTYKLTDYYTSFKKLVAIWKDETECEQNTTMITEPNTEQRDKMAYNHTKIRNAIKMIVDSHDGVPSPSLIKKYLSVGDLLYQSSSQLDEKINLYENQIRRPYFHIKPLDKCQIVNWHQYIDFVEMQQDFDWAIKLFERCLIPCANYSEFWIRYVEFVESNGGREIAINALERARKIFCKRLPGFNHYYSMFKEKIGDGNGSCVPSLQSNAELDDVFIENVNRLANREKRMGNVDSAFMAYEKALELAKVNQNCQIFSILCIKFAQLKFVVSNNIDPALEVFMRCTQEMPSKSIIQEMINFVAARGGPGLIPKLDSIVTNILAPESSIYHALSSHDRENISNLFLEFVDLYGNITEIRKAWFRHWKMFPHTLDFTVRNNYTPTKVEPLVNGVVRKEWMLISGFHQTCRDNVKDINMGREELLKVTEDVENESLNNNINEGKEEEEVAEAVANHSIPEKNDEKLETTESAKEQLLNDNKIAEELLQNTEDVEKQPKNDVEGIVEEFLENGKEYSTQVPPLLENFSANSADNDHAKTRKSKSEAGENAYMDEGNSDEVTKTNVSDPLDVKPSTPFLVQGQNSPLNSKCDSTPRESQSTQNLQLHTQENTNMEQSLPFNVSYSQTAAYYGPSPQSQQWQSHSQLQYAQSYPYQQSNDPYQNVQLQAYAYAQSQSGTQTQANSQGMPQQMLQYYQQQHYYLQQQQNQQLQNTQQFQQVLYMQQQQQQQQQLYQQQQQQYYIQQQQIIQQQQFQQLTQQEQQQLLQQHQQQFLSQMQQQFLQLQQQHQQQLPPQLPAQQLQLPAQQQEMPAQQQLQTQQKLPPHQQQPLEQNEQLPMQRQKISASDLSSNFQQNLNIQQHSSNQDEPDCKDTEVTSQCVSDKFQNAEKSASSVSHHPYSPTK